MDCFQVTCFTQKVSVRKGNEYKTKVSYYMMKLHVTAVETPVITNTYTAPTGGSAELEIQKAATENWTGKIRITLA